jgi:hypothetical protein
MGDPVLKIPITKRAAGSGSRWRPWVQAPVSHTHTHTHTHTIKSKGKNKNKNWGTPVHGVYQSTDRGLFT